MKGELINFWILVRSTKSLQQSWGKSLRQAVMPAIPTIAVLYFMKKAITHIWVSNTKPVKHLDIARNAFALELKQRDNNQTLITQCMVWTDEVMHSDLESDHNKDTAKGIDKLSLHT